MAASTYFVLEEEGVMNEELSQRIFRDHIDSFSLRDAEFIARYRLSKEATRDRWSKTTS